MIRGTPGMKHLLNGSSSARFSKFSFRVFSAAGVYGIVAVNHHALAGQNPEAGGVILETVCGPVPDLPDPLQVRLAIGRPRNRARAVDGAVAVGAAGAAAGPCFVAQDEATRASRNTSKG